MQLFIGLVGYAYQQVTDDFGQHPDRPSTVTMAATRLLTTADKFRAGRSRPAWPSLARNRYGGDRVREGHPRRQRHPVCRPEPRSTPRSTRRRTNLLEGQYKNPVRAIAFNTTEGWSRDVSEDIAHELRRRYDLQLTELPETLEEFVNRHEVTSHDRAQLRLVYSSVDLARVHT